jgi:hypothetical protein
MARGGVTDTCSISSGTTQRLTAYLFLPKLQSRQQPFSKARRKLKPAAIRELVHRVADAFEETHGDAHRFKGRRVFAVDGAKISTQRSKSLADEFGMPSGAYCPQIMISALFDVVAKVPCDVTIAPYRGSERSELLQLLHRVKPGEVVVLDRGYPSHEVIEKLLDAGIDFLMRVPARNSFKAVDTFLESGMSDCSVLLRSDPNAHPASAKPIELRAVRREGKNGEALVFLTSLRRREFTRNEILQLYQMRWEVELFYRLEKGDYLGHDQFHARTPEGVRQEVFAMMLYVALSRHLMATAAAEHDVPYDEISQKGAILATADYLTRLLTNCNESAAETMLARLLERIARRREPKRPNRSFPRRSFKPRPRWCATGRVGTSR